MKIYFKRQIMHQSYIFRHLKVITKLEQNFQDNLQQNFNMVIYLYIKMMIIG